MSVLSGWTARKQLICPGCGDVLAEAVHRRWPPELTVRAPAGYEIMPRRSAAVQRDLDAGRLGGAGEEEALREMLFAHHADLVYELTCGRGHLTIRAAPQIVRAVRHASGDWADLG
ncbi:hypothetical protein AB0C07_30815 [Actinoplanes missouriensis]|uniref:hypothetical protein n=1 Tax=Actinoplanes missouriensis TaxID=1866 RepID=UPI0033DEAA17